MALRTDGTLLSWGDNRYGQTNVPAGLTNIVVIAAGGNHSLALQSDGALLVWGDNTYGQTNVSAGLTNVVAIDAGYAHSLALLGEGSPDVHQHPPQRLSRPEFAANGTVQILFADDDGGLMTPDDATRFEIRASTNLVDWVLLTNGLSFTNSQLLLRDPASTNYPCRFYRVIQP